MSSNLPPLTIGIEGAITPNVPVLNDAPSILGAHEHSEPTGAVQNIDQPHANMPPAASEGALEEGPESDMTEANENEHDEPTLSIS